MGKRHAEVSEKEELSRSDKGMNAMKKATRIAFDNGTANMTLDEINAEMSEYRRHETEQHSKA